MNIRLKFRWMESKDAVRVFILKQLKELESNLSIEIADILIERETVESPWVWVRMRLVIPGPDLIVCARDYTFSAAWLKAAKDLKRKIKQHQARLRTVVEPARAPRRSRVTGSNRTLRA